MIFNCCFPLQPVPIVTQRYCAEEVNFQSTQIAHTTVSLPFCGLKYFCSPSPRYVIIFNDENVHPTAHPPIPEFLKLASTHLYTWVLYNP